MDESRSVSMQSDRNGAGCKVRILSDGYDRCVAQNEKKKKTLNSKPEAIAIFFQLTNLWEPCIKYEILQGVLSLLHSCWNVLIKQMTVSGCADLCRTCDQNVRRMNSKSRFLFLSVLVIFFCCNGPSRSVSDKKFRFWTEKKNV